jgi:lysozyme
MKPSQNCIDLVKKFEGYFENAYLCPAGVPTIGFGSTRWLDNKPVQLGQKLDIKIAEDLLMNELNNSVKYLNGLKLNQNQVDACLSFIYNLGASNFLISTLYKKIKANANDRLIENEFMRWNKARVNGKLTELKGLTRRRKAEAELYFNNKNV